MESQNRTFIFIHTDPASGDFGGDSTPKVGKRMEPANASNIDLLASSNPPPPPKTPRQGRFSNLGPDNSLPDSSESAKRGGRAPKKLKIRVGSPKPPSSPSPTPSRRSRSRKNNAKSSSSPRKPHPTLPTTPKNVVPTQLGSYHESQHRYGMAPQASPPPPPLPLPLPLPNFTGLVGQIYGNEGQLPFGSASEIVPEELLDPLLLEAELMVPSHGNAADPDMQHATDYSLPPIGWFSSTLPHPQEGSGSQRELLTRDMVQQSHDPESWRRYEEGDVTDDEFNMEDFIDFNNSSSQIIPPPPLAPSEFETLHPPPSTSSTEMPKSYSLNVQSNGVYGDEVGYYPWMGLVDPSQATSTVESPTSTSQGEMNPSVIPKRTPKRTPKGTSQQTPKRPLKKKRDSMLHAPEPEKTPSSTPRRKRISKNYNID